MRYIGPQLNYLFKKALVSNEESEMSLETSLTTISFLAMMLSGSSEQVR